jgi:hypothetical protein
LHGGKDYPTARRRNDASRQVNPRVAQDARAGFLSNYGKRPGQRAIAMDVRATDSYRKMFPDAARIGRV